MIRSDSLTTTASTLIRQCSSAEHCESKEEEAVQQSSTETMKLKGNKLIEIIKKNDDQDFISKLINVLVPASIFIIRVTKAEIALTLLRHLVSS